MQLTYISFCVLFFAIGHISEILYASITKRQFNAYATKNLLDFFIFVVFFVLIWVTYSANLSGTWKELATIGNESRAEVYLRNFVLGAPRVEISIVIICTVSLWVRVFYMLRYNEYMGKLSGIVIMCLKDIMLFFAFFLVELLFFAALA